MILSCNHIRKAFGTNQILSEVSFHIEDHEKAAIVGINGAGKSTLLKIIVGELAADSGDVILSRGKTLGYLAQHQDLDSARSIYEELREVKRPVIEMEQQIRTLELQMKDAAGDELEQMLAAYSRLNHTFELENGYAWQSEITGVLKGLGFEEEEFDKKVSTLSGGQKTRLSLGKLLLSRPDIILLDEPTNHLDIQSQQVLQKALSEYPGSYCIVSHNRSFLDPIVTKVLEFVPGEKPRVYLGNVSDYLEKVEREQALAAAATSPPSGAAEPGAGLDRKARRRMEAEIRQKKTRLLRPLQEKLELLEEEIARLETEKTEITSQLERPEVAADTEAVMELTSRFQQTDRQLETCFTQWADLSEKIEETEARIQEEAERNVSGS